MAFRVDDLNKSLYVAAYNGDVESTRKYVSDGANVNYQENYGMTPLYIASCYGHTDVVRILLENKANPNISNTHRKTPLYIASNWGHTAVVRILLENKANPNISDIMIGDTPLDVARNTAIARLLTAHGAATLEDVDNGNITDTSSDTMTTTDPSNTTTEDTMTTTMTTTDPSIEGAAVNVTPPSSPPHSIPDDGPANIEVYIEEISEVVTGAKGKMKVVCFLLHGAPCVGKTSAKRLLLDLPPLGRGNSTILMEDVVKAIRNIGTIKVMAVNESCLELEVMDGKKTIQMIQREIQKFLAENKEASREKSKSNKESSPASPRHATNDTVHDHRLVTPTPGPSHSSPDEGKSSPPPITKSANPSRSEVLRDIATDLDSLDSSTDGPTLFQCHHINIVDSGGQSQFSNLLPLVFLSQLHHHLVTIRLDQLLSEKPVNCYSRDGTIHQLPEHLVLTNYQLIKRVCQLAAGSQSRVIIIATRLDDQNTEELLAKKNELLKPLVQKYADNIVLNEQGDPIFAVNAMAPVGEERKGYTRMLQKVILKAPVLTTNTTDQVVKKDGIDVPLRWIVLEQELNRKSEDVGVFEMTKTISIADDLQVKRLTKALDFFKELALLYHYPVLPDKVFTSITPISLRLSEVVKATLVHDGCSPFPNYQQNLQRTGMISNQFLKELCCELPPNKFFSLDDFVSLMIHLRVFFPIDPDTIFIPSLLPVEITEPLDEENLHKPLLCYWMHDDDEVRILPQSYFHALIVELLGRKETIKLNTMRNHSRSTIHLIALCQYELVVVDCDFWFEVFVDNSLECKQRQLLLELIQSCTARVLEQLQLSSRLGELQYGLRCYSGKCCVEGARYLSKCMNRCKFRFMCLKSGKFWREEESGRHFWFRDDEHPLPQKSKEFCTEGLKEANMEHISTTVTEKFLNAGISTSDEDGRVTSKHLALLQRKLRNIHSNWKMFGGALPLSDSDINAIEANVREHKDNRTKFHEALVKWKNKGGTRTWRVIHTALCNIARKDVADSIIKKFPDLDSDVPHQEDGYVAKMTDVLKRVIPEWKSFALELGLDDAVVEEINGEPTTCRECFRALLCEWIQVRGNDANVIHILLACEKIDNELAIQLWRDEEMQQKFPILNRQSYSQ